MSAPLTSLETTHYSQITKEALSAFRSPPAFCVPCTVFRVHPAPLRALLRQQLARTLLCLSYVVGNLYLCGDGLYYTGKGTGIWTAV